MGFMGEAEDGCGRRREKTAAGTEQLFPSQLPLLLSCPGLVLGRGLEDEENSLCSAWPRAWLQIWLRAEDEGGEKLLVPL